MGIGSNQIPHKTRVLMITAMGEDSCTKKIVSNIVSNVIKIQSYLSAESGRKVASENRDLTYVQRRDGNGQSALYMHQIV